MAPPTTFWETIDSTKFGSRLAQGVTKCQPDLDAFRKALSQGPGTPALKLHHEALKIKDLSKSQQAREKAAKETPAYAAGVKLAEKIETELLDLLRPTFSSSSDTASDTKSRLLSLLKTSVSREAAIALPIGQLPPSPELRAELQIEAFLAIKPFVKKLLQVCTDRSMRSLWKAEELPILGVHEDGRLSYRINPDEKSSAPAFAWSPLAYSLSGPLNACLQLLEPLLPNRWIRRRLAEDSEFLECSADAYLLDKHRLELLEDLDKNGEPSKPIEPAIESMLSFLTLLVHPLSENSSTYTSKAAERGKPIKVSPEALGVSAGAVCLRKESKQGKTIKMVSARDASSVWNIKNRVARPFADSSSLVHLVESLELRDGEQRDRVNTSFATIVGTMTKMLLSAAVKEAESSRSQYVKTYTFGKRYDADKDVECCDRCKKAKSPKEFKRCSRCKVGRYCSQECQTADWKDHKVFCVSHG